MKKKSENRHLWRKPAAVLTAAVVCSAALALPAAADAYKSRTPDADQSALQWVKDVKDPTGTGQILSLAPADDGVIGVGRATGDSIGYWDGYLVKTSSDGSKVIWSNRIVENATSPLVTWMDGGDVYINSLAKLSNGDYVAVGSYHVPTMSSKVTTPDVNIVDTLSGASFDLTTTEHGKNNDEALILTFDTNGKLLSASAQGSTGKDSFSYVSATSDGGFIVLGSAGKNDGDYTGASGASSFYEKFKADGTKDWIQYEAGRNYWLNSIAQNADGTYYAAGADTVTDAATDENGNVTASAGPVAVAAEFAADGSTVWTKAVGDPADADVFNSLAITSDGGFVAVGYKSTNAKDYLAAKFSSDGNAEWVKSYGGSQGDYLTGVVQQADGSYVAYGLSGSQDGDISDSAVNPFIGSPGNNEMTLVKLEKDGSLGWISNASGSKSVQNSTPVIQVGKRFFVGGYTYSTDGAFQNAPNTDFLAAFGYDNDGDGVPNIRDSDPDDASKDIDADFYASNVDLTAAAKKTLKGDTGSLTVRSYDDFYADDGVTPLLGQDNVELQFGAVAVRLPALALDHLFYIYKAPESLTFGVSDITAAAGVSGEKVLYAGDITVKDADGSKLDTSSLGADVAVTFTIPAGSGYDASKNPKVVHIKDDGTVEDVSGATIAQNADGSLTVAFTTGHFSTYAVVQTADTTSGGGSGDGNGGTDTTGGSGTDTTVSNPATGSPNADPAPYILLALLGTGAAGAAMVTIRRRHN